MSDYEKWKRWFDEWRIKYKERNFCDGDKWLVVDGDTAVTIVEVDSKNNFIRLNASE